jgi:hypothetical protein
MGSSDNFVAIIGVLVIFGLPITYAMLSRWFAHQERMAMIQRGIVPPVTPRETARMYRHGIAAPGGYGADYGTWQAQRSLRGGIVLTMIGFALVVGLSFIRPGQPGPWLLGGLIPMFVGLAQIAIAVLSGARFGPPPTAPPAPGLGEPGQAEGPFEAPPREPASGPYAWRPGSMPGLERPPSPPDTR